MGNPQSGYPHAERSANDVAIERLERRVSAQDGFRDLVEAQGRNLTRVAELIEEVRRSALATHTHLTNSIHAINAGFQRANERLAALEFSVAVQAEVGRAGNAVNVTVPERNLTLNMAPKLEMGPTTRVTEVQLDGKGRIRGSIQRTTPDSTTEPNEQPSAQS